MTDEENRKSVINKVLRESGRIDVLVNNAGVLCPGKPARSRGMCCKLTVGVGPILDADIDVARKAFETNFFAPLRLAQLVVPSMAEQGGGVVVNIGSIAGTM